MANSTALWNIRRLSAIDKGLGRGSPGHNHIVAAEFDVEVPDPLDRLALHD